MWPYTNTLRIISHKSTPSGLTRGEGWVSSLVSFIFDRDGKRKRKTSNDPAADHAVEKGRNGDSDRDGRNIRNKNRADGLKIFPAKPLQNFADSRGYAAAEDAVETYIESSCYAHAKFLKQQGFSKKKATKAVVKHEEFIRGSMRRREKFAAGASSGKHSGGAGGGAGWGAGGGASGDISGLARGRGQHPLKRGTKSTRAQADAAISSESSSTSCSESDEDEDMEDFHVANLCKAREKKLIKNGMHPRKAAKEAAKFARNLRNL